MAHRVYTVGRDQHADIEIGDNTVSRFHAEFVIGADGGYYLADRSSSGGTALWRDGAWQVVRQTGVDATDRIKLGGFELVVQQLIDLAPPGSVNAALPSGHVKRDPVSGEVIGR